MEQSKKKPNFLFLITHDTGRNLGCYNSKQAKTPNIDKLAQNGVRFINNFATAPQCSPSRGSMITGKFPHTNGLMGLVNEGWDLPEKNTIPRILSEHGYSTHLVGLQHEHHDAKELGYQFISDRDDFPFFSDNVLPKALEFLQKVENGEVSKPFYCSMGFFETHLPYATNGTDPVDPDKIVLPDYLPDTPETREEVASFYECVQVIDKNIGKILDKLNESSFVKETVVIFTVDHGWPFPRAKCTLYDPGIATPLIINWPGKIHRGKAYSELVSNVDLMPTILDLAGVKIHPVDGRSILPLLRDRGYVERKQIFAEMTYHDIGFNPIRAVRTQKWKYIKNFAPLDVLFEIPNDVAATDAAEAYLEHNPDYRSPRPGEELYNLENDPEEKNNLTNDPEHETIRKELEKILLQRLQETCDPVLRGRVEVPEKKHNSSW